MIPLETLIEWTREAGAIALTHYRDGAKADRKADRSFVTAADRAVERFFREKIQEVAPDMGIIGEEEERKIGTSEWTAAIDPIDGTGSFVAGIPTWTISAGLLKNGEPARGVIHLPVSGEMYTVDENGAKWDDKVLSPPDVNISDREAFICIHSTVHRRVNVTFPGKTRNLGSMAYHLCLVGRGVGVAATLGHSAVYDLAAGVAFLKALGGELLYLNGSPVSFPEIAENIRPKEPIYAVANGCREVLDTLELLP